MTISAETFVRTWCSPTCEPRTRLSVRVRHVGAVAVVDVDGDVDLLTSATFGNAINEALSSSPVALVLDLSSVAFCSCAGLTVLLDTVQRVRHLEVPLRLVCTSRVVLRPLHVTGLVEQFQIRSSLRLALEDMPASA
jgi:anti-sigma B factor antagonist